MKSVGVVIHADACPETGIDQPGSHHISKNPRRSVEKRKLPALCRDDIRVKMHYAGRCGTDVYLVTTNPDTGHRNRVAITNTDSM